jgi:hypothetical protein
VDVLHRPNLPPPTRAAAGAGGPYGGEIRRLTLALVLSTVLVLGAAPLAGAAPGAPHRPSATTEATIGGNPEPSLPRTDLEAEERDNGHTSQAPYVIWSGIACAVVVLVGGLLFKRRFDRENQPDGGGPARR